MLTRPVSRAALLAAVLLTAAGCGSQAATPQAGAGPASPSAARQGSSVDVDRLTRGSPRAVKALRQDRRDPPVRSEDVV